MAQAKQAPAPKLKDLKEKLKRDSSQIKDNSKLDEERGFQADNVGPFQVGTINSMTPLSLVVGGWGLVISSLKKLLHGVWI